MIMQHTTHFTEATIPQFVLQFSRLIRPENETIGKFIHSSLYTISDIIAENSVGIWRTENQRSNSKSIEVLLTEPVLNETTSGGQHTGILNDSNLVESALDAIQLNPDQNILAEAKDILLTIQNIITLFTQYGYDFSYLSPLRANNVDDGSIWIEWIFTDFRIGFTVEPNPDESGWYLVSNEKLGNISASGILPAEARHSTALWLIHFVISNAES